MLAGHGFNGRTKCTFLLSTSSGFYAPAFSISRFDYRNFMIQYVEWADATNGITTDALMPEADETPYKIGTYTRDETNFYFNPLVNDISQENWPQHSMIWLEYPDPEAHIAGSIG